MEPPIKYIPEFVPNPDAVFAALSKDLEWERRSDAPRCEYYCNDIKEPYVYGRGKGRRLYEVRPWHPAILEIRAKLEETLGTKLEVCFLNRYLDQSDWLGWHADDSPEMDDARPIISVSLGVERDIQVRPKNSPITTASHTFRLGNGSAFVMLPGMQDTWQHKIPKASFQCGERISLTFRGYVIPDKKEG
jgi:alkylated DNA repair dioxygenase AlkB